MKVSPRTKRILSFRLTQDDLEVDLQNKLFGHHYLIKGFSIGLIIILLLISATSTILSGTALGNAVINSSYISQAKVSTYASVAAIVFTILIWLLESSRSHPMQGIHKGLIAGLFGGLVALAIAMTQHDYSPVKFFPTFIFLFIAALPLPFSVLISSVALGITLILSKNPKNINYFLLY